MDKTVLLPEWRTIDSDELDEPASSYGTITRHEGYRAVAFSGGTWPEGELAEQVRGILSNRAAALEDLGGSVDDVTFTRFYVREDVLSREAQARIHEVRSEFFDRPHYPASTMIGVAELLDPDALVEVEVRAEIPDDEWDVTVLTGAE